MVTTIKHVTTHPTFMSQAIIWEPGGQRTHLDSHSFHGVHQINVNKAELIEFIMQWKA